MKESKFIVIDGPDGSGKGSLINKIESWLLTSLEDTGFSLFLTKEPGSNLDPVCNELRKLILNPDKKIVQEAELLLYLADRCQHVRNVIEKKMSSKGNIILCDRYIDSTYAYQGWGRYKGDREKLDFIDNLNKFVTNGILPDISIFLMAEPKIALERLSIKEFGDLDRIEKEDFEFHERVYSGFLHLYEHKGERKIFLIDSTKNDEEKCFLISKKIIEDNLFVK